MVVLSRTILECEDFSAPRKQVARGVDRACATFNSVTWHREKCPTLLITVQKVKLNNTLRAFSGRAD
jgi:hypothetical protein